MCIRYQAINSGPRRLYSIGLACLALGLILQLFGRRFAIDGVHAVAGLLLGFSTTVNLFCVYSNQRRKHRQN